MSLNAIVTYTDGSVLTIQNDRSANQLADLLGKKGQAPATIVLNEGTIAAINERLRQLTLDLSSNYTAGWAKCHGYQLRTIHNVLDLYVLQLNLKDFVAHVRCTSDDFMTTSNNTTFNLLALVLGFDRVHPSKPAKTPVTIIFR